MKKIFLVSYTLFFSAFLFAEDLGVYGKLYPINEKDLIQLIKEKIEQKKLSGDYHKLKNDLLENGRQYADRPNGAALPRAYTSREFAIDPTYTLDRDITDGKGNIIYPKGYTFNPLDIKSFNGVLCFFNGDDLQQIDWAKENCNEINFKKIMASGSIKKVTKIIKGRIYFDQNGFLINHFRIENLPATVRQIGNLLYVKEFSF